MFPDVNNLQQLTIRDKRGHLTALTLNRVQRHFYENRTGRDLVIKTRQTGISTLVQGVAYKCFTTAYECNVATITPSLMMAKPMRDRFELFANHDLNGVYVKGGTTSFTCSRLNSVAYIGTHPPQAITFQIAHVSEFAHFNPFSSRLEAITEAVPHSPYTWIVIESTPSTGKQPSQFEIMCRAALKGQGEYKLHFYQWWWHEEYALPLKGKVIIPDAHEQELIHGHGLTLEQINWRRKKIEDMGSAFFQEYPEDVESCFNFSVL
jgi:hypothetical protein